MHIYIYFQDYNAKLSDFGLAIDGPEEDQTHVTTRVMGTRGYAAPEYIMTGIPVKTNFKPITLISFVNKYKIIKKKKKTYKVKRFFN